MEYKKKLIEVALPLEAINEASAREKSIRHGHPSTLHLWWARRPLATARAVIFSSLVDDPSAHPEQFPTEEKQEKERKRLFDLIEQLVIWENLNNETILNAAKAEIWKSTNGNPPVFLDPFAGGGAIPLEAQRLGLEAHASDLNPVAVMINKAMIEIPPMFAGNPPVNPESQSILNKDYWKGMSGLAEDVRYYGEWMKKEAFKRIGHLYPKVKVTEDRGGVEATVIAWIWARTVKCPNPACRCKMPLVNSFDLCKKTSRNICVEPFFDNKDIFYKVREGSSKLKDGTVNRAGAKCVCCEEPVSFSYIREQGMKKLIGSDLIAIVAEGKKGRIYVSPDEFQRKIAEIQKPHEYPTGTLSGKSRVNVSLYGFDETADLFSNRQLKTLTVFADLIEEVQRKVENDALAFGYKNDNKSIAEAGKGAKAYGQAVGVYLSFAVDKAADAWSSLVSWRNTVEASRNTFARQALPMVWDYTEVNPFSTSCGNWTDACVGWVYKVLNNLNGDSIGEAKQFDAQSDNGLRDIMISTDPPYYDNISYADLSDFFYVWLRESLKSTYPNLFRTMLVPKAEELVATPYRFAGNMNEARNFFEEGMFRTFKQIFLYSREDIPVTIYYAFKQSESDEDDNGSQTASTGWETMLSAIINAGFSINGTWPMRTEKPGRIIGIGSNALASSIIIVCRKRNSNNPICTRRELLKEFKRELKPALHELQRSNIAPVDLAQSAIGPGMAVFSRYSQVLESDGQPMSIRSALQIINQELDLYFSEQDGALDQNSRFCVDIYSQFAFNDLKFGEADVLARAKNTAVDRLVNEGALFAQKGIVHLLTREEIGLSGNPKNHFIWLLTQQLTCAMETGGITACAQLISLILDSSAENAKNLAYRLFTIAERKKWAEEAYAYNSLVVAWPDIMARVAELACVHPEQISLEDLHN